MLCSNPKNWQHLTPNILKNNYCWKTDRKHQLTQKEKKKSAVIHTRGADSVKIQNLHLNWHWTNWWSLSGKRWGPDTATAMLLHSSDKCTCPVNYFSTAPHISLSCGSIWKTHKTIKCIILTLLTRSLTPSFLINVYITWNTVQLEPCFLYQFKSLKI